MIRRILVAVEDAAPALAAARFAIDLATSLDAELGLVTVVVDDRDPRPILRHVTAMAVAADVTPAVEITQEGRTAFQAILDAATTWGADVIVIGRSARRPSGRPYVGSQTEHVLEFSEIPVVVVPGRGPS